MVHSETQVVFYEYEKRKKEEDVYLVYICCICRREILEYEPTIQCPNCQTFFHSNHLSIWLNTEESCPVCCCFFPHRNPKGKPRFKRTKKRHVLGGKIYQCIYCNHIWEAKSSGQQLWCPECGITSCPKCNTAFGFEYLLGQLQLNGFCPKCNEFILIESLKAKMKA